MLILSASNLHSVTSNTCHKTYPFCTLLRMQMYLLATRKLPLTLTSRSWSILIRLAGQCSKWRDGSISKLLFQVGATTSSMASLSVKATLNRNVTQPLNPFSCSSSHHWLLFSYLFAFVATAENKKRKIWKTPSLKNYRRNRGKWVFSDREIRRKAGFERGNKLDNK